jgi:hypothetical protein
MHDRCFAVERQGRCEGLAENVGFQQGKGTLRMSSLPPNGRLAPCHSVGDALHRFVPVSALVTGLRTMISDSPYIQAIRNRVGENVSVVSNDAALSIAANGGLASGC